MNPNLLDPKFIMLAAVVILVRGVRLGVCAKAQKIGPRTCGGNLDPSTIGRYESMEANGRQKGNWRIARNALKAQCTRP